jgi:hypothetical protein
MRGQGVRERLLVTLWVAKNTFREQDGIEAG